MMRKFSIETDPNISRSMLEMILENSLDSPVVVKELSSWVSSKSPERPSDKEDVLFALWYDGWNFMSGIYDIGSDCIKTDPETEFSFSEFDAWLRIPLPGAEIVLMGDSIPIDNDAGKLEPGEEPIDLDSLILDGN